jgi:uncharacterized protein YndB with AHSA1/START domain
MSKARFVYVTYIRSTPERVFDALTDPELTSQYWGRHRNRSDWKVGSRWTHEDYDDAAKLDVVGTVVERTPPRRLVVTWAAPGQEANPDKTSRLTYSVDPFKDLVRLTVLHEDLDEEMLRGVSGGWPLVLASLKTLLETGETIPSMSVRWSGPPPEGA